MPNRIIRDWTDSDSINGLSWQSEVLFIRLIMKADDFGRFSANPRLLRSVLFPLRDGLRDADISRWMAECQKAGLIRVYSSKDGKPLLQIEKFNQRTRAEKSKFDEPPTDGSQLTVNCQSGDSQPLTYSETYTETKTETAAPPPRDPLLDDPRFGPKWTEWLAYRRKKRKAVSEDAAKKQLSTVREFGISRSIKAIDRAITCDWQGFFPEREVGEAVDEDQDETPPELIKAYMEGKP